MSSMKLLILGLLMENERHPYEIRQTIKMRNWHTTFNVRDGSLYYAVDQMREHDLIEASEIVTIPGENRPDKTIYRITEKGRKAFLKLLDKQILQVNYPQHPLFAALPFIMHGEPRLVLAAIEQHSEACKERITMLEAVMSIKGDLLPKGSIQMIRGIIQLSEAERSWLEEMRNEAESGRLFESPCKKKE
ncbi:PadR family transcriptional regulator [Paenibacillus sp. HB172176]|uniref:PadR family transcriptional regulator n=1 Tax=Paenibacillus sp. HB172176 TaxID=2493690 RepID=UPI0014393494|nr:PadR family transcriptional regulator [Paenibacillus sp. HB172176]